ncbi:MAG: tetratricopeptide repeat protein [Acidobacteriota bacterium]
MKNPLRPLRLAAPILVVIALATATLPKAVAQNRDNIQKPLAGPRAAALRITWLYVSPDQSAQKVGRVQVGREMVVAEKSGDWLRVFANTDVQEMQDQRDQPWIGGENDMPPPITGWLQAKGIVEETMPGGDEILFGAAANQEAAASDPRGPANAAKSAEYLYRRVAEMFPNSPLAPEAAWRAADIQWQLQKADQATRPSAKEQAPYMREGMDESAMKHVMQLYPRTPQAAKAAFEMLDNKLCGDWQGQEKCPEREADLYEHYAAQFPDGPRTARALYEALYRTTVLVDMFHDDHNDKGAREANKHAHQILDQMRQKYPKSDYTDRAAALVFKSDQGVPVYGIDME